MMMRRANVLGIGVATMDIYVNRKRMYPGGNEYNVACNASFQGARAGFMGVFADDFAGLLLEENLVKAGVDVSMSHHEHGCSGYSLVEIKEDGDRVFLDWNKEGVTELYPILFEEEEIQYIKTFDVACLGRCASVSDESIRRLWEHGVDLCYDFHATYTPEEVKRYAALSKYAFFSCSHLKVEEIKSYLSLAVECGCEIAVGTRGSESIFAFDGSHFYEQDTFKVKPIDALGAGDSYIGAFLTSYIAHADAAKPERIQTALRDAAKHSSAVVLIEGSIGVGYDCDTEKLSEIR